MHKVSIVIPTLFPTLNLETYIPKLSQYPAVDEVIVAVNTTGADKDENTIRWRFLGKNRGYTGACNAGAKSAVGDLILFLNDDCEMTEEAFSTLVDFMEKNVDVVATQPIVMKRMAKGERRKDPLPEHLSDSTPESLAVENIGFWVDTRIGKAYPVTENSNSKQDQLDTRRGSFDFAQDDTKPESLNACVPEHLIFGLSGTCLLIRKEIFMKVGMWDESFHSYLEDVDMAIRLVKVGYKVAPCLDAEVTHEHMATSSKMGLYKEKRDVINWWRLILKHPDVFVRPTNIFLLLLERGRNMSGLSKKILRRMIQ